MPGVARVGDLVTGLCNGPGHDPGRPFTGAWTSGSPAVTADGLPVVRVGDTGLTDCSHVFYATTGSSKASADGYAIHLVGGLCVTEGAGTGTTLSGSSTITAEE